jgi:norsolorinic acid ketoreductase
MFASRKIYLVTGASRGLGRGLVDQLLTRQNTIVIAAFRSLDTFAAVELQQSTIAQENGTKRLIVIKIDSASPTAPFTAIQILQQEHPEIDHIDVVIANAAYIPQPAPLLNTAPQVLKDSFQVNTIAPLLLFQATWHLLQKSAAPKFIGISASIATIGKMADWPMPMTAYGSSKSALNYVVAKMHHEVKDLVAFTVHPGWVQTDAGNAVATSAGMGAAPDAVEDSARWVLGKVSEPTLCFVQVFRLIR